MTESGIEVFSRRESRVHFTCSFYEAVGVKPIRVFLVRSNPAHTVYDSPEGHSAFRFRSSPATSGKERVVIALLTGGFAIGTPARLGDGR